MDALPAQPPSSSPAASLRLLLKAAAEESERTKALLREVQLNEGAKLSLAGPHSDAATDSASLRPVLKVGAEEFERTKALLHACPYIHGQRPQPGDKVKLTKFYKLFGSDDGCLKPGQIGTLLVDDRTSCPFYVKGPNDGHEIHWYCEGAIEVVNTEAVDHLTPLEAQPPKSGRAAVAPETPSSPAPPAAAPPAAAPASITTDAGRPPALEAAEAGAIL